MVKTLRVKNWEEFQHYKDRCPPWIKLHRTLIDDFEFSLLQDDAKAHLILIWLLASQHDGKVPFDANFLQRKLGTTITPDLDALVSAGFLLVEQVASKGASKSQARSKQNARLEEKRREEKNSCANAEAFTRFWDAYPKKKNKGQAERTFAKLDPDEALLVAMVEAIGRARKTDQWRRDGGQFIPYPATWLNAKGWLDEGAPVIELLPRRVQLC